MKLRLLGIIPSTNKHKKYTALFNDGKRIHFGGKGCGDYTIYTRTMGKAFADIKRRAYISRHSKGRENWKDPQSPGALSRWILWEEPTVDIAVKKYNVRFS